MQKSPPMLEMMASGQKPAFGERWTGLLAVVALTGAWWARRRFARGRVRALEHSVAIAARCH